IASWTGLGRDFERRGQKGASDCRHCIGYGDRRTSGRGAGRQAGLDRRPDLRIGARGAQRRGPGVRSRPPLCAICRDGRQSRGSSALAGVASGRGESSGDGRGQALGSRPSARRRTGAGVWRSGLRRRCPPRPWRTLGSTRTPDHHLQLLTGGIVHDIDRTQLEAAGEIYETGPYESPAYGEVAETGSPFSEAEETELAYELLGVSSEEELDQFLG